MQQLRVVDLAHTMGITPRELIFKLRSIGVTVTSEEDTLDLSTVRAIITGETLQRRPREVIVRREKAEDIGASSMLRHGVLPVPAVFAIDRQGVIQFAYTNADYKVRLPAAELLAVAREIAAAD